MSHENSHEYRIRVTDLGAFEPDRQVSQAGYTSFDEPAALNIWTAMRQGLVAAGYTAALDKFTTQGTTLAGDPPTEPGGS